LLSSTVVLFGVPRFEFFCDQDRDSPGFHAHSDELIRLEFGDLPGSDIVDAAIFATLSRPEQDANRSHPDGAIPGRWKNSRVQGTRSFQLGSVRS
jgi:hypothetical protein